MSGFITAAGFGALTPVVNATNTVKQTIAQLTAETSSGYLASTFDGLGSNAPIALNLSPQIAEAAQVQVNADAAGTIASAAQSALGQISTIASNFAGNALNLITNPASTGVVSSQARDALAQVASLLDTKVGNIYVFAGQDSTTPPVPDPSKITGSAFYQAIAQAVSNLSANGQPAISASTLAIASPGGTSPFSASLEAGTSQSIVDVGGRSVALAPLANTNSDAPQQPGNTSTGSYTRDILRGLATLGALTPDQASDPAFVPLVQDTVAGLNGAASSIQTDIGALGNRQNQITSAASESASVATALKTQLSNAQDADYAQVAAQLSQAQTRLQASYQLISQLSQLSLTKFLPA